MNDKHVMIDRHQYDLQAAELCDLRTKLARLYDPTPITGEWLVACGCRFDGDANYTFGDDAFARQSGVFWVVLVFDDALTIRTRGEFRRAAELLGIQLKEKGGE